MRAGSELNKQQGMQEKLIINAKIAASLCNTMMQQDIIWNAIRQKMQQELIGNATISKNAAN